MPLIYHYFYVSIVYASAAESDHVDQQQLVPLVLYAANHPAHYSIRSSP